MGGSGGGGPFVSRKPADLARQVRKAEEATSVAAFEAKLSTTLADLLGSYNGRDVKLVQDRLDDIKGALEDSIEGTFDQLFGGSVAKHTYVDGLSDVDSLVIINDTGLERYGPVRTLDRMTEILRQQLGKDAVISHGRIAVTVEYPDGMKVQLLPAIKTTDGGLRVPSSRRDGWSDIDPAAFREALTKRNEQCAGKLVPTIKLAKAINGTLPESQRLSGYHMESLAIAAFRNYQGPKTTAAMLPTFFEKAKELVLRPIKDSTGQSVHVDAYLGPANSEARVAASHILSRLAKRMHNASAAGSVAQWQALFGLNE
jgi:hypothetical protein